MVTITWTWVTLSDGCLVQFRHQKSLVSVKIVSRKSWIHLMRISKVEISQLSRDSQSHSERSCENTHSHWALIQPPCGDTSLSLLISTKRKTHQFTYVLSTWRHLTSHKQWQKKCDILSVPDIWPRTDSNKSVVCDPILMQASAMACRTRRCRRWLKRKYWRKIIQRHLIVQWVTARRHR